jgi:1-acyl-sn-glycerol-3-phosphate acyltransferase
MIAGAVAGVCRAICGPAVEWRCDQRTSRQRVYFANHASHLDFVLIWSAVPADMRRLLRPVAGRDYWDTGRLRRYFAGEVFRAVLIERSGGHSTLAAAAATIDRIANEIGTRDSVILFPEGTRGSGGAPGPFKSGLFHLARVRPDLELIPVSLDNLNRILPKGEVLPVPMLSRIVFGPPLAHSAGEGKERFLARARDALVQLRSTQ